MTAVLPNAPAALSSSPALFAGHPLHRRVGEWVGGVFVEVRPVVGTDAAGIASLVRNLSSESSYRRFLGPVVRLNASQLATIVDVDHSDRETLVALVRKGRRVRLVGFAQYVRVSEVSAEMAVVVADAWQGRGIGRFLLQRLIAAATEEHFEWLTGDALSTNRAIIGLLQTMPGHLEVVPEGTTCTLLLRLDQPGAPADEGAARRYPDGMNRTTTGASRMMTTTRTR